MNINSRKEELIGELDLNIKYLQENRDNSLEELKKCFITILTTKDKVHYKYLKAKVKFILGCIFSDNLTNNYIQILHDDVVILQNELLQSNVKKQKEEEKAYLSYWLNKVNSYNKKIAYLKCQRKEIKENILTKKNIYELGTLEEIDSYERKQNLDADTALINKGLIKYQIEMGYLANPNDINDFIKELRNNFYHLIKENNNVTLDNINVLYNIAYQITLQKFKNEPVVKPSISRMIKYLRKHNQILINEENKKIIDSSDLYEKYANECFNLFLGLMKRINYIDIDEIERLFNICRNAISEEMNYYPEYPLTLKKVLPKTLKQTIQNKKQI